MNEPALPLRRSTTDRVFAGVLGGFAKRFDLDPTGLRIGFVILSVLSVAFPGILVYLLCWLAIPLEDH
ncbi:PspC domain protein [Planctomycetes bacterium Poly30]|uniref:PspC domain protein n=1 Tax=Saltatorellus ferox TaxID=2528018 RepID=A0A518ENU7_9BACT|nr:PspC domain protein [Planctomycetes bacterium Poly30]